MLEIPEKKHEMIKSRKNCWELATMDAINYDFLSRHRALVTRLLSQGYKVNRLFNTYKRFCGRHTDLVGQYKKNVCQMFAESTS